MARGARLAVVAAAAAAAAAQEGDRAACAAGPPPDVAPALACLRLTTPGLALAYPPDADAHFAEIRDALAPWWGRHVAMTQSFSIEDVWIDHFWDKEAGTLRGGGCLRDRFGPFVPLFVPWTGLFVNSAWGGRYRAPEDLYHVLTRVLRPSVAYVTVNQNDDGLWPRNVAGWALPNVLVLSAGGYGHVPIPLFGGKEHALATTRPPAERTYDVTYFGSMGHAPGDLRHEMRRAAEATDLTVGGFEKHARWTELMADSRASLVPRGFGRTAYHLVETLQMGLVPVYVYSDVAWLPYRRVYDTVGFATDVQGLPALLRRLKATPPAELEARERNARALRETHFVPAAVMGQVQAFVRGEPNDLICQQQPATVRDAGWQFRARADA